MRGVLWITGLSGAGKTTLAQRVVRALRDDGIWVVHVDGDKMQGVVGSDVARGRDERLASAWRIARTCAYLANEGAFVVCSTVSMFEEIWSHNRANLAPYMEVLLDVPLDVLRARDARGMYRTGDGIVGTDIDADWPDADMVLPSASDLDLERNTATLVARARALAGPVRQTA